MLSTLSLINNATMWYSFCNVQQSPETSTVLQEHRESAQAISPLYSITAIKYEQKNPTRNPMYEPFLIGNNTPQKWNTGIILPLVLDVTATVLLSSCQLRSNKILQKTHSHGENSFVQIRNVIPCSLMWKIPKSEDTVKYGKLLLSFFYFSDGGSEKSSHLS